MSYPQPPNDPQQSGYPQRPPAPAPGTPQMNVDFSALTAPENRGYFIAGIGGLVVLFAYFFLPFYGVSSPGETVFGTHIAGFSYSYTPSQGASVWPLLNFAWLGGLVGLAAAVWGALGIKAIPQLTPQLTTRITLISGVVALVALIIGFLQANSSGLTAFTSGAASGGFSFGLWLAMLAAIATIVGGVMQMQRTQ